MSLLEFCASFVGRDSVQKQWKVVLSLSWAGSSFLSFVALKEEGAAAEGAWVDGGPSVAGLLGSWENLPREDPRPPPAPRHGPRPGPSSECSTPRLVQRTPHPGQGTGFHEATTLGRCWLGFELGAP